MQITQAQFETRVPLLNATSDTVLDFGSGLSLRAATAEETARWFQDEHVRDVVPHRVFPHILWVLVAEHRGRSTEELEYYLMAWFGTASLLAGREVEAAFSEEWAPRSDGSLRMLHNSIKLFPLSLPVSSAPPWQGPIPLQRLCDGIVASIPRFRSETKNARIFHFALSRWIYAQNSDRRTAEDAVLDLSIALEAIFIGHGERIPVAKAMRERIAVFWSGTRSGSAARKMRDDVCDAYDVRSMVAHGQVVEGDRLDSARKLFDGIVRETLLDFAGGGLDDFDPMTLWVPA